MWTWLFFRLCGKLRIIALLTKIERHPYAVSPNSDILRYTKRDWETAPPPPSRIHARLWPDIPQPFLLPSFPGRPGRSCMSGSEVHRQDGGGGRKDARGAFSLRSQPLPGMLRKRRWSPWAKQAGKQLNVQDAANKQNGALFSHPPQPPASPKQPRTHLKTPHWELPLEWGGAGRNGSFTRCQKQGSQYLHGLEPGVRLTGRNFVRICVTDFPVAQSLSYRRTSLSQEQLMWKRLGVFHWLEFSMSQKNLCRQSSATSVERNVETVGDNGGAIAGWLWTRKRLLSYLCLCITSIPWCQ